MLSKMPKIIIATTVAETFLSILKDQPFYLAKHFNVTIVSSPNKKLNDFAREKFVDIRSLKMNRGISPLKDFFSIMGMVKIIFDVKPQIIQSFTPKAGLVLMVSGYICRVPVRVHTFTGLIFPTSTGIKKRLLILIDRLICFCATDVVPESCGVKKDLIDYKITEKPLNLIGHGNIAGVDTFHFSKNKSSDLVDCEISRNSLKIKDDAFVFCFVGRLNKDKGIRELVDAFLSLEKEPHLIIIGSIDKTAPIDGETLKKIDANPRIHCLGFVSDVRKALCFSNVLVLPSYREGYPNVILEAGSMELPVIATRVSGCSEFIDENFNGWLCEPRDTPSLQKAMKKAQDCSINTLREMGARSRKRVIERHELNDHLGRTAVFYLNLLNRRVKNEC